MSTHKILKKVNWSLKFIFKIFTKARTSVHLMLHRKNKEYIEKIKLKFEIFLVAVF